MQDKINKEELNKLIMKNRMKSYSRNQYRKYRIETTKDNKIK
jgi:hypothetical protein